MRLLTKIQYQNYEPGEFTDEQDRTYDETIRLIEDFPWEQQRDHLAVGLTNPSITIEGKNNDFLKLASFYHGRFVLHYFNDRKQLYTQSIGHYPDAYNSIRSFFESSRFDPVGFRMENTWLQHNSIHFQTQDFRCRMNPTAILFSAVPIAVIGLLWIAGWIRLLMGPGQQIPLPGLIIAFTLCLSVVLILARLLLLLINHYKVARGMVLIISRGKDIFFFGPEDSPAQFNKNDILDVITYGIKGRYNYGRLARVEINLTDGHSINISCLIIRQDTLINKFRNQNCREIRKAFPFMPSPSSASTLS